MRRPITVGFIAVVGLFAASSYAQTEPTPQESCVSPKVVYAEKNWRDAKPQDGRQVCDTKGRKNTKEHFFLYRHYRQIAVYHCPGGLSGEHYYVKPCAIVECESEPDYSWGSYNSSGAAGPYQLMPEWDRPWPVRTFRDRLTHHEIAAPMSLSNWNASRSCWG